MAAAAVWMSASIRDKSGQARGDQAIATFVTDNAFPALSIRIAGSSVLISWPEVPGFALESKTALTDANWTPVGTAPTLSNGVNTVMLPATGNTSCFRFAQVIRREMNGRTDVPQLF
jgi:hypothetical protein